ncbi:AAA family ATPase [Numidum massiliense]|uniref:AAA family ATPase n=1 Tax=Numidum massiliense TaxID=1522315 RepID=UPI0006D5B601|nr:AAA family ATPase [Numidum massiliense]
MWIKEIHVYGFGGLRDVSWQLGDGLNVALGLNEAGKSTLMAFVRAVLFGFESRRNPELRYEPREGGTFGGALTVVDEDGRTFRVERIYRQRVAGDVTVHLPDGGQAGEAVLSQLVKQMNEKVFKNIFAFGLRELQEMDTIREDEINRFIYTVGTGDGNAILRVQKELQEREQALYRPSSSKARINANLRAIRDVQRTLAQLKQNNRQYGQLTGQRDNLAREIEREEERAEVLRRDMGQLEQMLAHFDDYNRYVTVVDRLAVLPAIERFPTDGVPRLEALERQIRDSEAQQAELEDKCLDIEQQLAHLDVHLPLLKEQAQIEALRDHVPTFQENKEQITLIMQKSYREQERLTEILQRLGDGWTAERVAAFDTSLAVKQAVRDFAFSLNELKTDTALAQKEQETAKRAVEVCEQQRTAWLARKPRVAWGDLLRKADEGVRDKGATVSGDEGVRDRGTMAVTDDGTYDRGATVGTDEDVRDQGAMMGTNAELNPDVEQGLGLNPDAGPSLGANPDVGSSRRAKLGVGLDAGQRALRQGKVKRGLEREQRALEQVKQLKLQLLALEERLLTAEERLRDYSDSEASLRQRMQSTAKNVKNAKKQRLTLKWLFAVLTAVLPTVFFAMSEPLTAVAVFAVLAIVTANEFRKQQPAQTEDDFYDHMLHDVTQKKEEADKQCQAIQAEYERMERTAHDVCRQFGQRMSDLFTWEEQLAEKREHLRVADGWQEKWGELERQVEQVQSELAFKAHTLRQHVEAYRQKWNEWRNWLKEQGFIVTTDGNRLTSESRRGTEANPPEWRRQVQEEVQQLLSPELALEMTRDVEQAKETIRRMEDLQAERDQREDAVNTFIQRVQTVIARCNVSLTAGSPDTQVRELTFLLEKAKRERQLQQELSTRLKEVTEERERVTERLRGERAEVAALLQRGGATDQETFRERAAQYREREELQKERDTLYRSFVRLAELTGGQQILTAAAKVTEVVAADETDKIVAKDEVATVVEDGQCDIADETVDVSEVAAASESATVGRHPQEEAVANLLHAWSQVSVLELEDKLHAAQEELAAVRERTKQLRDEWADVRATIEHLTAGTDLSEQQHRYFQLVTELERDAQQWAAVALSRYFIEQAINVYEREKQPEVLKYASHYFHTLTEGRYVKVLAPFGKKTIEVETYDGQRREPAFLSRGTVEQLYLAIRFALVEAYREQACLPMVLDDIFVNFDPPRTRAAIRTLADLAEKRQILFFTCHRHVSEMFKQEAVSYEQLHLDNPIRGETLRTVAR